MNKRILIVEDEAPVRTGLVDLLQAKGFEVVAAETGPEGLTKARAAHPDLVLLDVMLPGLSGYDVLRTLRAEGHATAVIMVLPLFALLALLRLAGAGRALRALWAERAIALAQSNFVSAVSHEMRTPLTTIQLYAEMLAQDVVTEPARRTHYLETIAGESERLGRLIENVLDYARISGRRKAYRFEPLDVREVLQEALAAVEGALAQAGLAVELHAPLPVVAPVDRDALVQALINLLANAAKYAADGQRVLVSALPEAGGVALAVQDFGPGIAPAEQAKVFQPFYRVGSELTRTTTGSGLGLALVAETARAHGGRVELESTPGQGSAFKLLLPTEG